MPNIFRLYLYRNDASYALGEIRAYLACILEDKKGMNNWRNQYLNRSPESKLLPVERYNLNYVEYGFISAS